MSAYPDRASLVAGSHGRRSPSSQGFGPGGINLYHQQQIQAALYQQQQIEFAQQQAQLEMHLQLEQMRLQNLALQEQIMIGQAHAHQQAQAQAQQELRNTMYASAKQISTNRPAFNHGQGGALIERAMARRQQAEADALYAQYYPALEERHEFHDGSDQFLSSVDRQDSHSPPALVVSKPDQALPTFAAVETNPVRIASAKPKITPRSHQHTDSGSSASSNPAYPADSDGPSTPATDVDLAPSTKMPAFPKKFSDVVKSTQPQASRASTTPVVSLNTSGNLPKLNPFSSVFVPGSASGSEPESALSSAPGGVPKQRGTDSPVIRELIQSPITATNPALNVYRAPRSKSPPTSKPTRNLSAPLPSLSQPSMGATPTRQPRGPAAEAELTNQNFATRIRKRAIGAIKTLGTRPATTPDPTSATQAGNYQYNQQQQILEALMIQQHQHQALAAAGYLNVDMGFPSGMVSPGGIAHLMATARAREERFGY